MKGLDDHPHDAPHDPPQDTGTSLGVDAHLLGMLAYLFSIVSGVLILVLEKRHAEVRFHAAQSVVFSIAAIVLSVVASALMFVPIVGLIVSTVVWFGSFALWLSLLVQGYRLNHIELPVLGPLAVQLAGRA
jgi:uncharacterized membrane protein